MTGCDPDLERRRFTDLQALMVMGCDFGQGALVAPPMPKERFLELLRQRNNKSREQAQPNISVQPAAASPELYFGSTQASFALSGGIIRNTLSVIEIRA